jgi:hypothetical protein
MAKPWVHAESSARKWGGKPEDYLPIHDFMDSSKGTIADSRHRALTHNAWFISIVLEKVFGTYIINSDGRKVQVRDVGEQHVLEDFGGRFIPSAQDYLQGIPMEEWMVQGKGEPPTSYKKIDRAGPVSQKSWADFVVDKPHGSPLVGVPAVDVHKAPGKGLFTD